ncbi:hypothetical protein [Paenibacillus sp. MMS20-IR301]|uniref:hypothetical protein n=1 Tax=Paenibacillus sp. MMS20-IR301 TaxID=2895946 RepID=UPI0028ECDF8A|nr:hypothetical protein [Paenibacillus sp. MMS20-IR301]WNS41442.1 hypothetical protein LOS79_20760 [Paenibacillus sp. MMS20-IR301]
MPDLFSIDKIKLLLQMHTLGLLGGEVMPEDALLGIVPAGELPDVLTLAMSLNYQRSAYQLWKAVAEAYLDEDARWIFSPRLVIRREREELRAALLKYHVALQPNRHPEIWGKVAQGIAASSPQGNAAGLLAAANHDVAVLIKTMQITRKAEFPYLSGPKIFNYWLYVMETYAGIVWKSRELITVAADTHILQASVKLGLCPAEVLGGSAEDRKAVAAAWEKVLLHTGLAPIDIHTPLWLWSRAGFPPIGLT